MYVCLLIIAKLIQKTSRLLGNSGAAAPGLFIEKVWPRFLEVGMGKLPEGVVVISGTNGKTTTTKLVADTLRGTGKRVLTNRTGSNMTRGLLSLLVSESTMLGKLPFDIAILEVDEAYAARFVKRVPIRAALLLNVMRDQLDRFGEIDTTAKHLAEVSASAKELVVLNADDPRIAALPHRAKHVLYFGAERELQHLFVNDDDWHAAGQKKTKPSRASDVTLTASNGFDLAITFQQKTYPLQSTYEGAHNHLNIAASFVLLSGLLPKNSPEEITDRLATVKPAFGRGESIMVGKSRISLLLIKNPSSFTQTAKSWDLSAANSVTMVINDAYADSRDVSWLWDIDVRAFSNAKQVCTAGSRGADMAVRFKYDEVRVEHVYGSLEELIESLSKQQGSHLVFCTYTSMLALRKLLVKKGHTEKVT